MSRSRDQPHAPKSDGNKKLHRHRRKRRKNRILPENVSSSPQQQSRRGRSNRVRRSRKPKKESTKDVWQETIGVIALIFLVVLIVMVLYNAGEYFQTKSSVQPSGLSIGQHSGPAPHPDVDQLADYQGLRFGMSTNEVLEVFPNSLAVPPAVTFNTTLLVTNTVFCQIEGFPVNWAYLDFLNNRLAHLDFRFSKNGHEIRNSLQKHFGSSHPGDDLTTGKKKEVSQIWIGNDFKVTLKGREEKGVVSVKWHALEISQRMALNQDLVNTPKDRPEPNPLNLKARMLPLPATSRTSLEDQQARHSILAHTNFYVGGASMARGEDGKYHLFYSRWPKNHPQGFKGWLFSSEIARAVAEQPEGPYVFLETVLQGRGEEHWDSVTAHSPHIQKFDDTFYLYYVSTRDNSNTEQHWETQQYSQRIGVATASQIGGPWARSDKPLILPQHLGAVDQYVTNPSVARGPDGKYHMLLQGKSRENAPFPVHAVAIANSPLGPFAIKPSPLLNEAPAEDSCIWYDKNRGKFFALFKDCEGFYTNTRGALALMTSSDGLEWQSAAHPIVNRGQLNWNDGEITPRAQLQRPQVWLDSKGEPRVLFVCTSLGDPLEGVPTFNVHFSLAPSLGTK